MLPALDMERLIMDMMGWVGVSKWPLREKVKLPMDVEENLSWEHPIAWNIPTEVLHAGGDHLVSSQTVERFGWTRCLTHCHEGRRVLVPHRGAVGFSG